jgi:hypothetical protein
MLCYVESGSGCGFEEYGHLEGLCEYVKCPVRGRMDPFQKCFVYAAFFIGGVRASSTVLANTSR